MAVSRRKTLDQPPNTYIYNVYLFDTSMQSIVLCGCIESYLHMYNIYIYIHVYT